MGSVMAVEGVALILYGNSEIKRGEPKNRADLPSRWRADLPFLLLEEKLTNKKKEGRSARGQKKRTPTVEQMGNIV